MNAVDTILDPLSFTIALGAAAVCIAAACAFYLKRRDADDAAQHILRLAADIDSVAGGIDGDLEVAADDPPCVVLRQRSRETHARALQTLAQPRGLRLLDREALTTTLLLLHEDHRRIVDLRSDVDRALARRAQQGQERSRVIRFGRGKPSRWTSSWLLTRPSTFT